MAKGFSLSLLASLSRYCRALSDLGKVLYFELGHSITALAPLSIQRHNQAGKQVQQPHVPPTSSATPAILYTYYCLVRPEGVLSLGIESSPLTCSNGVALWVSLEAWWQGVRGQCAPDEQWGLGVQPQGLSQSLTDIRQGLHVLKAWTAGHTVCVDR